jgi:hypothetical protein
MSILLHPSIGVGSRAGINKTYILFYSTISEEEFGKYPSRLLALPADLA